MDWLFALAALVLCFLIVAYLVIEERTYNKWRREYQTKLMAEIDARLTGVKRDS